MPLSEREALRINIEGQALEKAGRIDHARHSRLALTNSVTLTRAREGAFRPASGNASPLMLS
jgi:hypothetical protein